MEDLAIVVHVGVVSIGLALALEARLERSLQQSLGVGSEGVGKSGGRRLTLRGRADLRGQDGEGGNGGDG